MEVGDRPRSRGISILPVESSAALDEFFTNHPDEESVAETRAAGRYRQTKTVTALEYVHAQQRRLQLMRQMGKFMEGLDMYVSRSGDSSLTNLTGHPVAVFPYRMENDQPRCIVVVGNLFADDKLLSVAHAYQSATDWHLKHPAIS